MAHGMATVMSIKPKVALISVHDKSGIADFARQLSRHGIEILSTGGTAKLLGQNKIKATKIESYTSSPEILGGRVKTLHPKVFGGILALRQDAGHMSELKKQKMRQIDMVVVNLYPFQEAVAKNPSLADALENIDIGGVSLIRAAAKNFENVAVVVEPEDYRLVLDELKKGEISGEMLKSLAVKAFRKTAEYDAAIDKYLSRQLKNENVLRPYFVAGEEMRYGENPYQKGWFYKDEKTNESSVANAKVLGGKQLSYNNTLDASEAFELVKEFSGPCCAIIKHTNPSGVCVDKKISVAYKKALACDSLSAFGCEFHRGCNLPEIREGCACAAQGKEKPQAARDRGNKEEQCRG